MRQTVVFDADDYVDFTCQFERCNRRLSAIISGDYDSQIVPRISNFIDSETAKREMAFNQSQVSTPPQTGK